MYENQIPSIDYVLITILSSVLAYSTYNHQSDDSSMETPESYTSSLFETAENNEPKQSFLSSLANNDETVKSEEPKQSFLSSLANNDETVKPEEPKQSVLSSLTESIEQPIQEPNEKPTQEPIEQPKTGILGGKNHKRQKKTKKRRG